MENFMICCCDVTNSINLNIQRGKNKSRPFYLAVSFQFCLGCLSITTTISLFLFLFCFLPDILLTFSNVGWVHLGELGLKILISTSTQREDGYSTNHSVQFMEEVKVI